VTTTGIEGVLTRLDAEIARAIASGDRRGYFAVLYRRVTAKVAEGLDAGFFDDDVRMERLDTLFAERYFEAVRAERAGQRPTDSWQLTFDAGRRWRPLVLQHLLVGINAHINLDLGVATAECVPSEELADLRRDYDRINAILAAMIATVQRDLLRISPWMGLLDRFGARTQTEVVRFSIVVARRGAWRFAERLSGTTDERWADTIHERDRRVAAVGRRVLHPGTRMTTGLLLVRLRERGAVADHLEQLLAADEPSLSQVEELVERPDEG
jgi:hypothetical protein